MTRVNVGIDVRELSNQLLFAEYREIIRIPNSILSGRAKVFESTIPPQFKLGQGHVMFFYNKLQFLRRRHQQLLQMCRHRGINVTDTSSSFEKLYSLQKFRELWGDYTPTLRDRQILLARFAERGHVLLPIPEEDATLYLAH